MNKLFPLPLYTFIKTAVRNGGFALHGLINLPPWLLKMIVFEPLRWAELTYNPKVEAHVMEKDPVFVLGFYRSGTSFMHQFLTMDKRFGYHTNFQMILPDLMLTSERFMAPFLDFICRTFNLQDPVHRIQMSFKFPGEEDAAMTTALNPRGAQWGYFFPRTMMDQFEKYVMFEGISDSDLEAWKKDFLFLIKKISLASKGKQLVLKSPPNTARIKVLLSMFPNAKFVFIHRNPYEVYASNKRFWKVTKRIYALGGFKGVEVNDVIRDTYARIMHKYLAEKDVIPKGQLIEMPYADFIQNPMENMEKIYSTLNLNDFNECKPIMQAYVDQQKSYVRLKHEGLPDGERELVTEKFKPFLKHWNYPLQ